MYKIEAAKIRDFSLKKGEKRKKKNWLYRKLASSLRSVLHVSTNNVQTNRGQDQEFQKSYI